MSDVNQGAMKIHFAWINWELERRRKLREKIKNSSEEEKVEIIKNLARTNAFLIKRNLSNAFSNLIYYKIFHKPEVKKKYLPKIYEIISKAAMYEDDILKSLLNNDLRLEVTFNIEPKTQQLAKLQFTYQNTIFYLKKQLDYYAEKGDIDDIIAVQSLLQEYIKNRFVLGNLFSDSDPRSGLYYPRRYDKLLESYAISAIYNYNFYERLGSFIQSFLPDLSRLLANKIKEEMTEMIFKNLHLEKSLDVVIQYSPLLNHILSIISTMYFEDLNLEEKRILLNENFEIEDLINLIDGLNLEWKYNIWNDAIIKLNINGFQNLALKLMNVFQKKHFEILDKKDYFYYYDTLGSIHRNLGHYEKALKNYQKAYEYVEDSESYILRTDDPVSALMGVAPSNSITYRKGICLKNIGESYGHTENKQAMKNYIGEVEEIIQTLENQYEQFSLYYNLAKTSRRLRNFELEQNFLNKAFDYQDPEYPLWIFEYIEQRVDDFLKTEMNYEKLIRIENDKFIDDLVNRGTLLQNCFHLKESIKYFNDVISGIENSSFINKKYIILKKLAFSYLFLREWDESIKNFQKLLSLNEDFESKLYLFIPLFLSGKKNEAVKLALELMKEFKEKLELNPNYFNSWVDDILNYFGEANFLSFINLVDQEENSEDKWDFYYILAIRLSEKGFSDLAIKLFEKELDITKNDKLKANYLNNIGCVHLDLDNYDLSIGKFKEAISVYNNHYISYLNMAKAYAYKLDYINAKKNLETAIKIAKMNNASQTEIEALKLELEVIELMLKHTLNINRISSLKVQGIFNTAERLFYDYKKSGDIIDASLIILEYAKGFETMLHEQISSHFKPLITKYHKKYINRKTSPDFHDKFGYLMQGKSINLGSWIKIIESLKEPQKYQEIQEFYSCLNNRFDDFILEIIKEACEIITPERNPISHIVTLSMEQIISRRKKIIELLNPVIDKLF